jgi:P27 family predicted phage terminase small subunit
MARGRKPNLTVIDGPQGSPAAPAWLPAEAKREWATVAADLASRGLLFDGAKSTLANYCLCIAVIQQRQKLLDANPGDTVAFQEQMKAINSAKLLATELGLTVTSRTRAFTAQKADKQGWDDVLAS